MQKFTPSPFHTELFNFLLGNVEKQIQEEGLVQEKEFANYKNQLKDAAEAKENHSFIEILESYQRLFSKNKILPIEKYLLEAFPAKNGSLKMYRGLPRVYKKDNLSVGRIKNEFSNLADLKRLGIERFILPLYEHFQMPKGVAITLFTYALADGWGDIIAAKEAFRILKTKFPNAQIRSIICIPKNVSLSMDKETTIISYLQECPPSLFSEQTLQILKQSDLVISLPTYYPYTDELKKRLEKTQLIAIGQYGFIESEWFHPKNNNYSMGLHFLEKGIFIREQNEIGDFRTIENGTLLYSLFGTKTPRTIDINSYLASHKFYLAYLVSPIGGAIYLHALIQAQSQNDKNIDICSPNIGWLIEYIKLREREQKPFFEEGLAVQELEIHFDGKIHRRTLASQGKKVRILCPDALSDADFRKILRLSEDFLAIRGDQSFSEAVSANRPFFYDGAPHARYFIKDLLALAQNRLSKNKMALSFFRCIGQAFLYNISDDPSEWVEETYFQEKEPWMQIAKHLSVAIQSSETILGCKMLNQIIKQEYSFNKTLCQIAAREISHRLFPGKAKKENQEILAFKEGKQSFIECLQNIKH